MTATHRTTGSITRSTTRTRSHVACAGRLAGALWVQVAIALLALVAFSGVGLCATKPLAGFRVFVDPGHGGYNPGAVGPTGLRESDVNLRVGTALRNCLVEYGGATVLLSRTGDYYVTLSDRATRANNWWADIFVSVHHNASYNTAYNGTEVYSYTYGSAASRLMRDKVYARLLRSTGLPDRGGARTANFYVLRATRMPAILTEASYISNAYEEARLRDPGYTWREGKYIYLGLLDYYTARY